MDAVEAYDEGFVSYILLLLVERELVEDEGDAEGGLVVDYLRSRRRLQGGSSRHFGSDTDPLKGAMAWRWGFEGMVMGSVTGDSKTGIEPMEGRSAAFASPPESVHVGPQAFTLLSGSAFTWQRNESEILIV